MMFRNKQLIASLSREKNLMDKNICNTKQSSSKNHQNKSAKRTNTFNPLGGLISDDSSEDFTRTMMCTPLSARKGSIKINLKSSLGLKNDSQQTSLVNTENNICSTKPIKDSYTTESESIRSKTITSCESGEETSHHFLRTPNRYIYW